MRSVHCDGFAFLPLRVSSFSFASPLDVWRDEECIEESDWTARPSHTPHSERNLGIDEQSCANMVRITSAGSSLLKFEYLLFWSFFFLHAIRGTLGGVLRFFVSHYGFGFACLSGQKGFQRYFFPHPFKHSANDDDIPYDSHKNKM